MNESNNTPNLEDSTCYAQPSIQLFNCDNLELHKTEVMYQLYKSTETFNCVTLTSVLKRSEVSVKDSVNSLMSFDAIVRLKKFLCIGLSLISEINLSGKRVTIMSLLSELESLTIKLVCENLIGFITKEIAPKSGCTNQLPKVRFPLPVAFKYCK